MNEAKARELLFGSIGPDDRLMNVGWYLSWAPGKEKATLDGDFTADELDAIAWWMRNTVGKTEEQK